ncbi:MAG: YdcF family protein [Cyclobacteriaceae bacterium]|nr:YdcF family protein [Cyclobacteriaceae bacterium]MCH8515586.1 YdcF family protein [Cyclobacteriaceae bacterium]
MRFLIHQFIINPAFWFVLAALFAFWGSSYLKYSQLRLVVRLILILMIIFSFKPIPLFLAYHLESDSEPFNPDLYEKFHSFSELHIMILGAGHDQFNDFPATQQLGESSLARLVEAVRIHQLLPQAVIIGSGYQPNGGVPESDIQAQAAYSLGLPKNRFYPLPAASITLEEAANYHAQFSESDVPLLIVSSAIHRKRAVTTFALYDRQVEFIGTSFHLKNKSELWHLWYIPSIGALKTTKKVAHEYLGLLYLTLFSQRLA